MKTQDITLLIQGKIDIPSLNMIDKYTDIFDEIIYSTWEKIPVVPNPIYHLKYDTLESYSHIKKVYSREDLNKKYILNNGNIAKQATTVVAGLDQCTKPYVLKIRADEAYHNLQNIVNLAEDEKINCSNIYFRHPIDYPYHCSDHMILCKSDVAKKTFSQLKDICFDNDKAHSFFSNIKNSPNKNHLFPPETYISFCMLSVLEPGIKIDFKDINQNIDLFCKYFNIIDVENFFPYTLSCKRLNNERQYTHDITDLSHSVDAKDISTIQDYNIFAIKNIQKKRPPFRAAVLFTGFTTYYDMTFAPLINSLHEQNFEIDVYLSSWDKSEIKYNPHQVFAKNNKEIYPKLQKVNIDNILSFYQDYLVDYNFIDYDDYYSDKTSIKISDDLQYLESNNFLAQDKDMHKAVDFWANRIKDQWYCVRKGWDLIDKHKNKHYNIVIKTRFDMMYLSSRFKKLHNYLYVVKSDTPEKKDYFSDYMCYGQYDLVEKYCKMYDYFDSMWYNDNINISLAEDTMTYYLTKKCRISVLEDKEIKYRRLKYFYNHEYK